MRKSASRRGERGVGEGFVVVRDGGWVGKVGVVGVVVCIGEVGGVEVGIEERAWATSAWGTRVEKMHARHERVAERT